MAQPIYLDPELQSLEREKQLALALQQRGMKPVEGQMVGNRFVAPSWTQYLANAYDAYSGGQRVSEAEKKMAEQQNRQQLAISQNVQRAMDIAKGAPEQTVYGAGVEGPTKTVTPAKAPNKALAIAELLKGRSPFEQGIAQELVKQDFAQPKWATKEVYNERTGNKELWSFNENSPNPESTMRFMGISAPALSAKDRADLAWEGRPIPTFGGQHGFQPAAGAPTGQGGVPTGGAPMGGGQMGGMPVQQMAVPTADRKYVPKDIPQYEYDPALSPKENMEARSKFNLQTQGNIKNAKESFGLIKSAVDILSTNAPSSGFIESGYTAFREATGKSTPASKADSRLKVIGETLTAKVPRFEGPQSDKDTASYRAAAGDVANTNKPIQSRLAALEEMAKLAKKYYPNGDWDAIEFTGPVTVKNVLGGTRGLGAKSYTPEQFEMGLKGQDKAAFQWLRKNPFDPRAEEVRNQLGIE
jgi:hypothetical protein